MIVQGGCHCGAVRFSVNTPEETELLDCNCSICSKVGYLHMIVKKDHFDLRSDTASLSEYTFGSGKARHLFCKICGVKSFYKPRSHPDGWSVNFRCLDEGHGVAAEIRPFDGQNWEQARGLLDD